MGRKGIELVVALLIVVVGVVYISQNAALIPTSEIALRCSLDPTFISLKNPVSKVELDVLVENTGKNISMFQTSVLLGDGLLLSNDGTSAQKEIGRLFPGEKRHEKFYIILDKDKNMKTGTYLVRCAGSADGTNSTADIWLDIRE